MNSSRFAAAPDPEWGHQADVDARGRANELAERLISRDRSEELVDAVIPVGDRDRIALHDVQNTLEHFNRQQRVLLHLDLGFPCVDMPGGVPLPIGLPIELLPEDAKTARTRLSNESSQLGFGDQEVRQRDPEEARGFLRRRLVPFLASRIATSKSAGPGVPTGTGYQFRVETPGRSGLRVHYSPAYFFDPRNVFGSVLSTPVDGLLLPGRYVFGAMALSAGLKWDLTAVYRVPGPPDVAQI
jgi:hypothetical protein